ncbi:hypothetical protein C8R42DRAFT_328745 [Lentinula raphanica]|nr:hypothetical protein C8R42DRAFT_328745 [Lentinula raphanica]
MPLAFEDFTAWIEVEGSELPLFDVKVNDSEASGWIPSEAGKKFIVKFATGVRRSSMCGDVYMDGKIFTGQTMHPGAPRTYTLSGAPTSVTTKRPFVFAKLELTDDDHYLNEAIVGLGDIKLVITHATLGGLVPQATYAKRNPIGKVHERSKKATGHKVEYVLHPFYGWISLSVGLQAWELSKPSVTKKKKSDPSRCHPPRTKSAVKTEVLDLTGDSDEENQRRIRSLEEELVQLRKRRKTQHIKTEPTVKLEPGTSSSSNRNLLASNDVIDLT